VSLILRSEAARRDRGKRLREAADHDRLRARRRDIGLPRHMPVRHAGEDAADAAAAVDLVQAALSEVEEAVRFLLDGAWVLGAIVLGGVVVLGIAFLRRDKSSKAVLPPSGWRRHLAVLFKDLALIGHSRYLPFSFLQSLPYLLLQVIPIWAAFHGYGFDLGLRAAFVLMVVLRLGSVVPQAPGNLGLFQFLTKECLERVFNVVPAEAARFSLVLWGIVTLPLLIAGFIALSVTEAKIGELKRAAEQEAGNLNL